LMATSGVRGKDFGRKLVLDNGADVGHGPAARPVHEQPACSGHLTRGSREPQLKAGVKDGKLVVWGSTHGRTGSTFVLKISLRCNETLNSPDGYSFMTDGG
jgi:hypothetical protein